MFRVGTFKVSDKFAETDPVAMVTKNRKF